MLFIEVLNDLDYNKAKSLTAQVNDSECKGDGFDLNIAKRSANSYTTIRMHTCYKQRLDCLLSIRFPIKALNECNDSSY